MQNDAPLKEGKGQFNQKKSDNYPHQATTGCMPFTLAPEYVMGTLNTVLRLESTNMYQKQMAKVVSNDEALYCKL